jgi:DNA repair protein RecO (recombination protein O)
MTPSGIAMPALNAEQEVGVFAVGETGASNDGISDERLAATTPAVAAASSALPVSPAPTEASQRDSDAIGKAAAAAARPEAPARKRSRPAEREHRIANQPAFILHSYPYKETSLIVDVLTRDHGRVALVAKGAKRPHSRLRSALQTFQPLTIGWSGKSEVRTLTSAEWIGGLPPLEKAGLLCGFYLNELLVKLLARDDPHPALFDHYVATLNRLTHDEPAPIALRKFELALLKETGVAGDITLCASNNQTVEQDQLYVVDPERGPRPARVSDTWPTVTGRTLLDMEREDYADSATQTQSKFLMRFLLAHHLGGMPLNTRQILLDLMQL